MKSTHFLHMGLYLLSLQALTAKTIILPARAQPTLTPVESYVVPHPVSETPTREVNVPGFLLSTELEPLCVLTQGRGEETLIADGILFECLRKKELKIDQTYSVLRKDPSFEDKSEAHHSLYWMVSQVRILSTDSTATGKVETDILPLEAGDWVVESRNVARKFQLHPLASHTGSRSTAIVAFSSTGQTYGSESDFVFLNQGRNAGLDVDAVLPIHLTVDPKTEPMPPLQIGTVQIIEATQTSAVGYLVQTTKEIPLGAIVVF